MATIDSHFIPNDPCKIEDPKLISQNLVEKNYLWQRLDLAVEDYFSGRFLLDSKKKFN